MSEKVLEMEEMSDGTYRITALSGDGKTFVYEGCKIVSHQVSHEPS